tara:strand:+ start:2373 stop:3275 length:903 start_codon:yes stop_codon:yes gene_type:complete
MATQYSTILKLGLPVQGELDGTWGDEVNNKVTNMVEEAIAGRKVIDTWSGNSHTLTVVEGATSGSRAAILTLTDTSTALTGAATVVCPANSKIFVMQNSCGQAATLKTPSGTGISVANGGTALLVCDGTNVVIPSATLENVLDAGNSTSGKDIVVSAGDDITFSDSSIAYFGAGSDLKIYHNGSNSYIDEVGTGSLYIRGVDIQMGTPFGAANFVMDVAGAIDLKHGSGATAVSTSATGIDLPAGKAIKVGTPSIYSGSGTPESSQTAVVGSLYMRSDGGESTSLYVKESGSGNTGWVAK